MRLLRGIIVVLLVLLVAVPATLYLVLSSDPAQERLRSAVETELSDLLGADVSVGRLSFRPFNRLEICDIAVLDARSDTALAIDCAEARFETADFIFHKKLITDYVRLQRPVVRLSRDSAGAPLNIAGIIARLNRPRPKKEPSTVVVRLNSVEIADGVLSYDVLSDSAAVAGRFCPGHILVEELNLQAFAPRVSADRIDFTVRRFGFVERSGFVLSNLEAKAILSSDSVAVERLSVSLPSSHISLRPLSLPVGIKELSTAGRATPVSVALEQSTLALADIAPFVKLPGNIPAGETLKFDAEASVAGGALELRRFNVVAAKCRLNASAAGKVSDIFHLSESDFDFDVNVNADADLPFVPLSFAPAKADIAVRGTLAQALVSGNVRSRWAEAGFDGTFQKTASFFDFDATVDVASVALGHLTRSAELGDASGFVEAHGRIPVSGITNSTAGVRLDHGTVVFRGHRYENIAVDGHLDRGLAQVSACVGDPLLSVDIAAGVSDCFARIPSALDFNIDLHRAALHDMGFVSDRYADFTASGHFAGEFASEQGVPVKTILDFSDITFFDSAGEGIDMKNFDLTAIPGDIHIASDYITGSIDGDFNPLSIVDYFNEIADVCIDMPYKRQNMPARKKEHAVRNDFSFDFEIEKAARLCDFFGLPVKPAVPVAIAGDFSYPRRTASVMADAPWLLQGKKHIENTLVSASLNSGDSGKAYVYATTEFPTQKGPMTIVANHIAEGSVGNTGIDWEIRRKIPINGKISFGSTVLPDPNGGIAATVNFYPGEINFGSDTWEIKPSVISWRPGLLAVDRFALSTDDQNILVDGRASASPDDVLNVDLKDIHLLDIFETLQIDKALISGSATGSLTARALFSEAPQISATSLHVRDIGYNRCTLGDADVAVEFLPEKKAFSLDADVHQSDGRQSHIFGTITPASEELDITFEADRVKVGFMKPFMEAFASDVRGYASGRAHLFGTFKYIDLEGDIYADSLQLKLDFTNTWYTASDSLHITPGHIALKDIAIRDIYGNSARLNGYVDHVFFHDPTFEFAVTDARNFLAYDVNSKLSPDWYGRIFGNGSAHVVGRPGVVDIGVNMSSAPSSSFTFVLSDTEEAGEYSFITFRDVTPVTVTDSITEIDPDVALLARADSLVVETPTAYNMDLQMDITPDAQMTIVMDPIGGDRIKANGSGNLRLTYGSVNNDLRMYGTYTLDRGSYNFTLQDIILKDFTIREGSSITFTGDPYSANLAINAVYSVNANLSDLDESFLQDKDLNRTNVPVNALLQVTGDMRQPDITFDLEFPTLTSDTYRKVRSIVSTEEMMNRQIIYLLALNRFYTPDYMASTTKGNELFSVASSTIASQLSSMLGKLSENWSIAPNLRSDRGDFSDVEVDLTLQSTLLNNRLLFNGNFGYRDKTLNTNQFVGDFDIEYLLNRKGSWRLKAYNRYNDQNYYLRTAATTQGVGIMYRRDFDNMFNFLRHKKKEDK